MRRSIATLDRFATSSRREFEKVGTSGLDIDRLTKLLRRIRVDCILLEGDEHQDHCLLRLSSVALPGRAALLEYVNQGFEPRLATIKIEPFNEVPSTNLEEIGQFFQITEEGIHLRGSRKDDPKKILALVEGVFLARKC